jgi:hypothetical protein
VSAEVGKEHIGVTDPFALESSDVCGRDRGGGEGRASKADPIDLFV